MYIRGYIQKFRDSVDNEINNNKHSPASSAEIKNARSYTSTHSVSLHGVVLN